jgi:hypothetical protein
MVVKIVLGGDECPMEGCSILLIEPVSRVEGQEIDFSAFRQVCPLVDDEPAILNAGFQGHAATIARGSQVPSLDNPYSKHLTYAKLA